MPRATASQRARRRGSRAAGGRRGCGSGSRSGCRRARSSSRSTTPSRTRTAWWVRTSTPSPTARSTRSPPSASFDRIPPAGDNLSSRARARARIVADAPGHRARPAAGLLRAVGHGPRPPEAPAAPAREARRLARGGLLPPPPLLRRHPPAAGGSGGEGALAPQAAHLSAEPRRTRDRRRVRGGAAPHRRGARTNRARAALVPGRLRPLLLAPDTARLRGDGPGSGRRRAHARRAPEAAALRRADRDGDLHRASRARPRVPEPRALAHGQPPGARLRGAGRRAAPHARAGERRGAPGLPRNPRGGARPRDRNADGRDPGPREAPRIVRAGREGAVATAYDPRAGGPHLADHPGPAQHRTTGTRDARTGCRSEE